MTKTRPTSGSQGKAHSDAPEWLEEIMTNQEIGEKLRDRRRLLRLRQRDLAELAGVSLRGLTELEQGKANLTLNQLTKLATVLGLEIRLTERSPHASS